MIILCLMSYELSCHITRRCSECNAEMHSGYGNDPALPHLFNTRQQVCSPACARARKSRLQAERRKIRYASSRSLL